MTTFIVALVALLAGFVVGYKWGGSVAAKAESEKSALKQVASDVKKAL